MGEGQPWGPGVTYSFQSLVASIHRPLPAPSSVYGNLDLASSWSLGFSHCKLPGAGPTQPGAELTLLSEVWTGPYPPLGGLGTDRAQGGSGKVPTSPALHPFM